MRLEGLATAAAWGARGSIHSAIEGRISISWWLYFEEKCLIA